MDWTLRGSVLMQAADVAGPLCRDRGSLDTRLRLPDSALVRPLSLPRAGRKPTRSPGPPVSPEAVPHGPVPPGGSGPGSARTSAVFAIGARAVSRSNPSPPPFRAGTERPPHATGTRRSVARVRAGLDGAGFVRDLRPIYPTISAGRAPSVTPLARPDSSPASRWSRRLGSCLLHRGGRGGGSAGLSGRDGGGPGRSGCARSTPAGRGRSETKRGGPCGPPLVVCSGSAEP